MTLGIGYQGRDFTAILTDSADFRGPQMTLDISGSKFLNIGPRFVCVISGSVPGNAPPDVSSSGLQSAARALRDWCWRVPQESDSAEPFRGGPQVLITDASRACLILRIGAPRLLEVGELVVIGNRDQRAQELGIVRNYGDLTANDAASLLVNAANRLTDDMYAGLGCTTVDEVVAKYGALPTVMRPFHINLLSEIAA